MKIDTGAQKIHPQALLGFQLYDQGEFLAAHEHLELAWMDSSSPDRELYQGVLQIGLAYYQIGRGNYRGALKMFRRGQRNLAGLAAYQLGIHIAQLREDALLVENTLRGLGAESIGELPGGLIKALPWSDQAKRL